MGVTAGYTVGQLLHVWEKFKEQPGARYELPDVWPPVAWEFNQWRAWFLRCLNAKINRNDPRQGWRKMDEGYQIGLQCDRRTVEDYLFERIRHTGCYHLLRTPELKRRYPHIDHQERED